MLLIMAATGNLGHFESLASCWPTSTRSSATTDAATDAVPPPGPHSPYDGQPHPVGADTRAVYEVSVSRSRFDDAIPLLQHRNQQSGPQVAAYASDRLRRRSSLQGGSRVYRLRRSYQSVGG